MATLEERVAYLEGKVEEHSHAFPAVQDAIGRLDSRFDARVAALEHRMDSGFDAVTRRFEALEQRVETLTDRMDRRFEAVDEKMSRQFTWMVGIQITTLIAMIGVVLSRG